MTSRFRWGWVRLFLGIAQMTLAAIAMALLLTRGFKWPTAVAVILATLSMATSRILYRGRRTPASLPLKDGNES